MSKTTARQSGYALTTPCAKCPFRSDVEPYLQLERAQEIAANLRDTGVFHCHKTTDLDGGFDDDSGEYTPSGQEQQCAGATILQEHDGQLGQMLRIAERIGVYDRNRMDLDAPVPALISDWVRRYRPETPTVTVDGEELEYEHCGVVGPDCEDPAGYGGGGGVWENDDEPTCHPVDDACVECGNPMCGACRSEAGDLCVTCAEEE
jgi:hypothetical protein